MSNRSPYSNRLFALLVVVASVAAAAGACSLIVDGSDTQCQTDADCARFPGTSCDTVGGVCVLPDGGAEGGACEAGADGGC